MKGKIQVININVKLFDPCFYIIIINIAFFMLFFHACVCFFFILAHKDYSALLGCCTDNVLLGCTLLAGCDITY
jgi:hypothetical protein